THCAHFKDTSNGTTASVTIKTTKVPKVGDQTLKAVLSAPEWEGGTTLVATRVGNTVITTFYNVQSPDMGAAGLGLTEKIAAQVGPCRCMGCHIWVLLTKDSRTRSPERTGYRRAGSYFLPLMAQS